MKSKKDEEGERRNRMEEKSLPHLPEAKTSQQEQENGREKRVNGREKKQENGREEKQKNGRDEKQKKTGRVSLL